jgi:hypothetical protein
MVATLDATDVAQAGRMVLIMDMLLNPNLAAQSESCGSI